MKHVKTGQFCVHQHLLLVTSPVQVLATVAAREVTHIDNIIIYDNPLNASLHATMVNWGNEVQNNKKYNHM